MCITKDVSLSVFIICTISCIYLYKRNLLNDRWIAILFTYVGIIQLLEYFIWKDQECSGLNQKATKIALYILVFQPIISFFGSLYYDKWKNFISLTIFFNYIINFIKRINLILN